MFIMIPFNNYLETFQGCLMIGHRAVASLRTVSPIRASSIAYVIRLSSLTGPDAVTCATAIRTGSSSRALRYLLDVYGAIGIPNFDQDLVDDYRAAQGRMA